MNFINQLKQHWFGSLIVFATACIGVAWATFSALYVGPREYDLNQKKEMINQLQREVQELKERPKNIKESVLLDEIYNLKTQLVNSNEIINKQQKQLSNSNTESSELKAKFANPDIDKNNINTQLLNSTEKINRLLTQLTNSNKESTELKEQLANSENQINNLKSQLTNSNKQISDLKLLTTNTNKTSNDLEKIKNKTIVWSNENELQFGIQYISNVIFPDFNRSYFKVILKNNTKSEVIDIVGNITKSIFVKNFDLVKITSSPNVKATHTMSPSDVKISIDNLNPNEYIEVHILSRYISTLHRITNSPFTMITFRAQGFTGIPVTEIAY